MAKIAVQPGRIQPGGPHVQPGGTITSRGPIVPFWRLLRDPLADTPMPLKDQPITVTYSAWNTSTNAPQTGDAANHSLRLIQDGVVGSPTNAPAEVNASSCPGEYSLTLVAADINYNAVKLCGKSSTANVVVVPVQIFTDRGVLPVTSPGTANGLLVAGANAATSFVGTNASGSNPATAGLTITGGAANTTVGGTAAPGLALIGGSGAASINGSGPGWTVTAGGTTTVAGNDAAVFTATGNGSGITLTHAGTGKDINAQTTNALQTNALAINGISTSAVATVNANLGTTQPINFTGSGGSALVKSDAEDWGGSPVGGMPYAGTPPTTSQITTAMQSMTFSAFRDVGSVADSAITLSDVAGMVAGLLGKRDVSDGAHEVFQTPAGTQIRSGTVTTSATNPFGVNFPVKRT